MRKSGIQRAWPVLLIVMFSIIQHVGAQEWTVNLGVKNPLEVSIQNLNPAETMTGVTVWVDSIPPGWSITPSSIALGTVAPASTRTARFTVSVAPGTLPGTTGTIRLRLTDDQGRTWTAIEKAALELDVAVGQTTGAVTRYGGAGTDTVSVVAPTQDGGVIMAGQSNSFAKGQRTDQDLWIVKMDHAGNVTWHATYGGTGNERADAIQPTGTFILTKEQSFKELEMHLPLDELRLLTPLAGKTYYSKSTFLYDVALYLVDDDYRFTVLEHAEYTPTGYIVAGTTTEGLVWFLKLDKTGVIEWQKVFAVNTALFKDLDFFQGASAFLRPHSLQTTNAGEYIVTGIIRTALPVSSDMSVDFWVRDNSWVMKLDALGNLSPQNPILSSGWDRHNNKDLYAIQETPFGDYLAVGGVEGRGWWLVKFNPNLFSMEQTFFGANGAANDIELTHTGNYLIIGSRSPEPDTWNTALLKLDMSGNPLWQKTFEQIESGSASSVGQAGDNGFVLGGLLNGRGWIGKIDAEGATEWEQVAPSNSSYLAPVWPMADHLSYLTAINEPVNNNTDITVLKLGSGGELSCLNAPVSSSSTMTTQIATTETNLEFKTVELFLPQPAIFENPPQKMPSVSTTVVCGNTSVLTPMLTKSAEVDSAPRLLVDQQMSPDSRLEASATPPSAIPEPSTMILVGMGILTAFALFKRQLRK